MRLLVDMGHPAHVHCANFVGVWRQLCWRPVFKNAIRSLEELGHERNL